MSDLELGAANREVLTCLDLWAGEASANPVRGIGFSITTPSIVGVLSPERMAIQHLVDLLTGFEPLHSGRIYLAGRRIDGCSATKIVSAGLVRTRFDAKVPSTATVLQVMALALRFGRIRGQAGLRWALTPMLPHRSPEINDALSLVGLAGAGDQRLSQLTGLDRVRLELARCLVQGPSMIIADQPFIGLSGSEGMNLIGILRAVHDLGITILVADHNTLALSQLCERVLILQAGRLIADGTPDAVGAMPHVQQALTGTELA